MPLSNFEREDFARSAAGIIGGSSGRLREGEIAGRLINRYHARIGRTVLTLSDHAVIQNIVRGQLRSFDQGRALESGPGNEVVPLRNNDWAISGQPERFAYRTRVLIENTDTGELTERYRVITSNTALSADEVRLRANAAVAADPTTGGRYPDPRRGAAPIVTEAFIIAAGVNPTWQPPAG